MKSFYLLLTLTMLSAYGLRAEEKSMTLPLSIKTTRKDLHTDATTYYYKKSYVTLKIPTGSKKVKLRCINQKIYMDSNGDGKINASDTPYGSNRILQIPAIIYGKKITYPVLIQYISKDSVMLKSLLFLETSFNNQNITVVDNDLDGKFIAGCGDKIRIGNKKFMTFSSIMMINGSIFSVELLPDKMQLILSPYRGKYAHLYLTTEKNWKVTLHLQHNKTKLQVIVDTSKKSAILPGKYTITATEAVLYGKADSDDDLFAAFDAEPPVKLSFTEMTQKTPLPLLKEGQNKIVCGPPLKLALTVKQGSNDWRSITLNHLGLKGALGEEYKLEAEGEGGKSLLANYIRSGSTEKRLAKMEYG